MMPSATLLLRESSTTSLTLIVEKSQRKKPPFAEYDLRLTSNQLDFVLLSSPEVQQTKSSTTDEGFESDIDTLSIVSSDDSFPTTPKLQETDSANGSASSDSDTETTAPIPPVLNQKNESYNLVNCLCYTYIKFPDVLVFVIKCEALVFRFDSLSILRTFYTNFTTYKAIANQRAYQNTTCAKFNLLQRTDRNGVTHIEITNELNYPNRVEDSRIISLNTPDFKRSEESRNANLRQRSESPIHATKKERNENSHELSNLKKVWKSADDLLEAPKRPERRRKKQKAPDPPQPHQDVLTGQYVRVNVTQETKRFQLKSVVPQAYSTLKTDAFRRAPPPESWTYSVPRFLRKPLRSQSEKRNLRLEYGYADYTNQGEEKTSVANRLFGMSSKLKDFTSATIGPKYAWETRRGSLGDLTYKINNGGGSLKSVIKKDDNKRKSNDKKGIDSISGYQNDKNGYAIFIYIGEPILRQCNLAMLPMDIPY
ncbi:hypothetical protein FQR65_LT12558 [Abscondita terminalis]|nr:hypothetical protein FQR65_LT12558 [Abscondita terminalis]